MARALPNAVEEPDGTPGRKLQRILFEADNDFVHSCRNPLREHLPRDVRELVVAGALVFQRPNWEEEIWTVESLAGLHMKQQDTLSRERWKQWAASAFLNGAKQAHRFTKIQGNCEVVKYEHGEHPYNLVDRAAGGGGDMEVPRFTALYAAKAGCH